MVGAFRACAESHTPQVRRFARDVVGPRVRDMDEQEIMDPSVIKGLFEQGVCSFFFLSTACLIVHPILYS